MRRSRDGLRVRALWVGLMGIMTGCEGPPPVAPPPGPGVPLELAQARAATITDLHYRLRFVIPRARPEPIEGRVVATFKRAGHGPVVFDFAQPVSAVLAVRVNGDTVSFEARDEHIIVPVGVATSDGIDVEIDFVAGEESLNRQDELLYTLFVPDRARFAFPVFDQPDLKARFQLELEVPADWEAVANGSIASRQVTMDRATVRFSETEPLSSYLFSFVVGDLQVEERVRSGRRMALFHRETESDLVARNVDTIFELHASALDWLEDFTGISYPFEKFDFVLVPSFQYGGMEHPGAILYRASSLFLDESATQNQQLARASVIAHETSHQWFGDLVTMRWFDDVWMKETFANYLAAKIVNPAFPDVDHDLRFFLAHYPAAYAVDRTAGANPIRQPLDNLAEAGTLYGAIIYQKAPIVITLLERLIGEETLRDGLREFLSTHAYGNAGWPDLIAALDPRTPEDLAEWSRVWVEESGRPRIDLVVTTDGDTVTEATLSQSSGGDPDRLWNQPLDLLLGFRDGTEETLPVLLREATAQVPELVGRSAPNYTLVAGYGFVALDPRTRDFLWQELSSIEAATTRAVAWVSIWETMLEGAGGNVDGVTRVEPDAFVALAQDALRWEPDELNIQRILGYLTTAFWRYLRPAERQRQAVAIEALLWERVAAAGRPSLASAFFSAYRAVAVTPDGVARLERIWREEERVPGVTLSERDFTALAQSLAVRVGLDGAAILSAQRDRIENADRRDEFDFVRPALAADLETRDAFFASLSDPANRVREPWVLTALGFLHHPLRARQSEHYIRPGLDLLEEIQVTGDIFFPERWLTATLAGHQTASASGSVQRFLNDRPDLSTRLRGKLLQVADGLARAARLVEGQTGASTP